VEKGLTVIWWTCQG